jgi:hypothetical protein
LTTARPGLLHRLSDRVQALAWFCAGGKPSSDHIDGSDLDTKLKQSRLSQHEAALLVTTVAEHFGRCTASGQPRLHDRAELAKKTPSRHGFRGGDRVTR